MVLKIAQGVEKRRYVFVLKEDLDGLEDEREFVECGVDGEVVRVLSYNILADGFCSPLRYWYFDDHYSWKLLSRIFVVMGEEKV